MHCRGSGGCGSRRVRGGRGRRRGSIDRLGRAPQERIKIFVLCQCCSLWMISAIELVHGILHALERRRQHSAGHRVVSDSMSRVVVWWPRRRESVCNRMKAKAACSASVAATVDPPRSVGGLMRPRIVHQPAVWDVPSHRSIPPSTAVECMFEWLHVAVSWSP